MEVDGVGRLIVLKCLDVRKFIEEAKDPRLDGLREPARPDDRSNIQNGALGLGPSDADGHLRGT